MYIGQIPTPTATESRQEFTATSGQTQFQTTGGTEGYCDCFLNGVKLDSRSDFSFDGSTITLTTGAAAGDVLAVVMRQADSALVALPIKDSAGNNVLSETNNVVSIGSGVTFPAGHVIQVEYDNDDQAQNTTASFVDYLQINITPKKSGNLIFITATIATHHFSAGTVITAKLVRDGTDLNYEIADYYHPSGGAVPGNISLTFIDNPTIPSTPVSINYKIQIKHEAGSGTTNKDWNGTLNGVSSLVVMEIQQ